MAYSDNTTGGRIIKEAHVPFKITLAEGCKVGDLLGYSSGWKRALATTPNQIDARLVAGETGESADVITAYGDAVIKGVSGATPGGSVYLAEGTNYGQTTQTAPDTTGDINAPIGIALSSDEIYLYPGGFPVYHDADHRA